MKKILLLVASLAFSIGFSQDKPEITTTTTTVTTVTSNKKPTKLFGKNEFKINALFLIPGSLELQYERILTTETSVGARIYVPLDDYIYYNQNFYLDGFYRFYFGKKPASGFFIEGLATYISIDEEVYNGNNWNLQREHAIGLGLQTGVKFIIRQGLLFEINAGLGRSLIESVKIENKIFGRYGISVGYRF